MLKSGSDQICDQVGRICYPLFKNTPIKYFDHTRFYDSGEVVVCGTLSPDVVRYYSANNLLPSFEEFKIMTLLGLKTTYLSHCMPLPPKASEINPEKYNGNVSSAADLKIFHRLYIVERQSDCYVASGFGVNREAMSIFSFYLNAFSILENFVKYFEHHAKELIDYSCENNRIIHPYYLQKMCSLEEYIQPLIDPKVLDFSIQPLRNNMFCGKMISDREMDCLELIGCGYTMKNAAKKLAISHRTVEQHLRNIKDKLGLSTKNQLVEIWHANEV